jgi:ferredoxin
MPDQTTRLRVTIDQSVCVGAGLCVLTADEVFDQRDEDGVVKLLQDLPPEALYGRVQSAARKCPSQAIKVEEVPADTPSRLGQDHAA